MSSGQVVASQGPKVMLGVSCCLCPDWRRVLEALICPGRCPNLYVDTPYHLDHYLHLRTHAPHMKIKSERQTFMPFSLKDNNDCIFFSFCHPSDNESEYRDISVLLLMMVSHSAKNILVTCYRRAKRLLRL